MFLKPGELKDGIPDLLDPCTKEDPKLCFSKTTTHLQGRCGENQRRMYK